MVEIFFEIITRQAIRRGRAGRQPTWAGTTRHRHDTVPLLPTKFVAQYQDFMHCEAGMSGFGLTAGVRAESGRVSTGCARATGTYIYMG